MFWRLICALLAPALAWGQAAPNGGVYRIAGTVVDALTGQPVPHAQLSINRAQTANTQQIVNADDNGHFTFTSLTPGKYLLVGAGSRVSPAGMGCARQLLDGRGGRLR